MRNIKFSIKLSIYISIICSSLMGTAQDLRIQIQEFKNRASVRSKNPTSYTPSGNVKSLLLGCIIPNSQDLKQKQKQNSIHSISDHMDKTKQKSREQFRGWYHSQNNPVSPELRDYKEDTSIPSEGGFPRNRPPTKAPTPPCSWLGL